MKELEEQCVCVKFCCELGKNFMGMIFKPKCNHLSGWGKVSSTKNSTDELVKEQGDVGCVF